MISPHFAHLEVKHLTIFVLLKVSLEDEQGFIQFTIEADSLSIKWRTIVGTLIEIGRGKLKLSIGHNRR